MNMCKCFFFHTCYRAHVINFWVQNGLKQANNIENKFKDILQTVSQKVKWTLSYTYNMDT